MKRSPEMKRLDDALQASKLVAGGFLGTDRRPVEEIVAADAAELVRLGCSLSDVAEGMRRMTALAQSGLGSWVRLGGSLRAAATDTRGVLPCPWAHPGSFPKTVVTVRDARGRDVIRWSMLNIHMIEAHGFFEGKGSAFRIDPKHLARIVTETVKP